VPICPKCDVAYLDGETHICPPSRTARERGLLAAYVAGGVILGTVVATTLLVAWINDRPGGHFVLGLGPFFGAPLGGWAGWFVGARRYPKAPHD
jgi:MFS family permease